jgi:hypothetical protein
VDDEVTVTDIVTRLRRWTHAVDAEPASDLMDQAAEEIENLRTAIRRVAEQDATLSVCDGNVTVDLDGTLTDEELWAVGSAMISYAANKDDEECVKIRFILRDLMRRLI